MRLTARPEDREILRLAWPALIALAAEPLFLLGDAAIVGRLGTDELAGLGVAAVVLQTAVGLCVFLAYGTTGAVARRWGASDQRGALAGGIDGLWLAAVLGTALSVGGALLAGPLVSLFDAGGGVAAPATDYLRVASLGAAPLLLMLAATGVLRGLQDTRTPMVVAVASTALNLPLNAVLVFGLGPVPALGIVGSAAGSVAIQLIGAAYLVSRVAREAHTVGARRRPSRAGVLEAGRAGVALFVRTLALRAAIVATAYVVTARVTGADQIAAHQLAMTIWGFLAFVLDAVAIAAQAIIGRTLGAGDPETTRRTTGRMVRWGLWSGVATGLLLAAAAFWVGPLFTPDTDVHRALVPALLVAAVVQPMAGVVFVLDGVLIGAGDGRYLAWASVATLAAYLPLLWAVSSVSATLTAVWAAFGGAFIGIRLVTLLLRSRGDAWLVLGSDARGMAR